MLLTEEGRTSPSRSRRWLTVMVSVGVTVIVVSLMAQSVISNLDVLSVRPLTINWLALAGSFGAYGVDLILAVMAWHLVVRRLSGVDDWRKNSHVYVSTLLARRLPGSFWHIVGRAHLYAKSGVPRAISSMVGVVEFAVFFLSGGALYMALWPWLQAGERSGWVIACMVPLGVLLLFPKIIVRIISRVARQDVPGSVQRQDVASWVVSYIAVWVFGGVVLYLLILSIYPISTAYFLETIAAWTLAAMVGMIAVFIPAGLGVRELTLSALLVHFVPAPYNVIVSVGTRVVLTLFDFAAVGTVYLCSHVMTNLMHTCRHKS